jgi:hypothetical protein
MYLKYSVKLKFSSRPSTSRFLHVESFRHRYLPFFKSSVLTHIYNFVENNNIFHTHLVVFLHQRVVSDGPMRSEVTEDVIN